MRLPSRFSRKFVTVAAASIAVVLVLASLVPWTIGSRRSDVLETPATDTALDAVSVRPVFSIASIDGIGDVLGAVRNGTEGTVIGGPTAGRRVTDGPDEPEDEVLVLGSWNFLSDSADGTKGTEGTDGTKGTEDAELIRAAVLPHHTLPAQKLLELWSDIRSGSDPSVIVVIGPNHENAGDAMVQTTRGVWTSPFGNVEADDGLVDRLVALGVAGNEPDSFVNEHAVGTHVPYLAALFPGVPIVPVIAKSPAGADDALSFVLVLQQLLPDDALVVSSIDFCHYLPQDRTDDMDAETLAHIAARRYTEIERLHSDHLDAPYAMIAYLLWNDRNGYVADLVWHDSSHRLKGDPLAPGTSYLAFFSTDVRADSASEPLTIALAGDIMLGRAVASALERTTVAEAFASAAAALDDAALAFANLESVLTSSASDTGKEIFFKGDPARTDVLRYLGFTHVSVANNHVDDYGYAGWEESVGHLADAGVAPVGDYGNDVEPVTADVAGRRAAFLAYDDTYRPVDTEAMAAAVADAAEKSDAVVVSFHWGVEYEHLPTARQKALAHAAVDAGADVVAGSHPHVLQGIETYGGGLVFYSLGNFVFDQVGKDENESVVAIVTWNDDGTLAYRLTPMRIVGTFPRVATAEESAETLARIVSWSEGL